MRKMDKKERRLLRELTKEAERRHNIRPFRTSRIIGESERPDKNKQAKAIAKRARNR